MLALYEWGVISEPIYELSMVLLHSDDWGPSSLRPKLGDVVPEPKSPPDDVPFAEGKDLIVDI